MWNIYSGYFVGLEDNGIWRIFAAKLQNFFASRNFSTCMFDERYVCLRELQGPTKPSIGPLMWHPDWICLLTPLFILYFLSFPQERFAPFAQNFHLDQSI